MSSMVWMPMSSTATSRGDVLPSIVNARCRHSGRIADDQTSIGSDVTVCCPNQSRPARMYVCMYVCMHACMHACMYVTVCCPNQSRPAQRARARTSAGHGRSLKSSQVKSSQVRSSQVKSGHGRSFLLCPSPLLPLTCAHRTWCMHARMWDGGANRRTIGGHDTEPAIGRKDIHCVRQGAIDGIRKQLV